MPAASPAEDRFWAKVQQSDGCWLWTGATVSGYGVLRIGRKTMKAHRFSWLLNEGDLPDGLHVCHHCDTPACVRPEHLFLGTDKDNIGDAARKGRMARGSRQALAKLTADEVVRIRGLVGDGLSDREIATRFGVFHTTIQAIRERKSWAWL